MTRRQLTYFPHDSGYDFGDAQHVPIVPAAFSNPPDASQGEQTKPMTVPGDAVEKETIHE